MVAGKTNKQTALPNYFQDNMRRQYRPLTRSSCLALGFSSTGPWQFHFHSWFFGSKHPLFLIHHKIILWILNLSRPLIVGILSTIVFSVRNWWGIGNVPRTSCWQNLFHVPLFQLFLLSHSDPTPLWQVFPVFPLLLCADSCSWEIVINSDNSR